MIRNRVKGYRVMLGMTQKKLGQLLGCTAQSISSKERGRTSFKDNEKLKLLELFKSIDNTLTIDEIFFKDKVSRS